MQVATNATMFDAQQCLVLFAGVVIVFRQLTWTLSSSTSDEGTPTRQISSKHGLRHGLQPRSLQSLETKWQRCRELTTMGHRSWVKRVPEL